VSSHKRSSNRDAEEPVAATAPAEEQNAAPAAEVETSIAEQIKNLEAEKQELTNTMLRRQADFENFKKRVEKERNQERYRGVESVVEPLLGVLDGFDRALAGNHDPAFADYRKGFELIRGQIWNLLSKQGLQRIDSVGKEFDPNLHHAIEKVETADHAEGIVVDELAPGFIFQGRVLRPAMVRVATGAPN
jgi:molecular chaperone GrpE